MIIQEIIVLLIFALAVAYLIRKFFFKSNSSEASCGSAQCGCSKKAYQNPTNFMA